MESDGYLDELIWQVTVFVLLGVAAFLAVRLAKRYRRWLARRYEPVPKWGGLSALGVGLLLFVVFAVIFGFFLDQTRAV